jgi:hypothetical protein
MNTWQTLLVLFVSVLVYRIYMTKKEEFVPYNSFEAPPTRASDVQNMNLINQKFGNLLQTINGTTFALSYELDNLLDSLQKGLDVVNPGKFKIVSVGQTLPFTLLDVLILDVELNQSITVKRIDFVVSSLNPFIIENIIVTPQTEDVMPIDDLQEATTFRIKNNLGLFYPYRTSYNDSILSKEAIHSFISQQSS